MKSQEIKEIYFGFYDQLIEPYCSQAKNNFIEQFKEDYPYQEPNDIEEALRGGFMFHKTEEYKANINHWYDAISSNTKSKDMVNHPSHYGGDSVYEYFKVAEAWDWHKRAYLWNAGKYMCRTGKKSKDKEVEDLEKAIVYLRKEIELLKNGD
jgi:hypothetical protein